MNEIKQRGSKAKNLRELSSVNFLHIPQSKKKITPKRVFSVPLWNVKLCDNVV